MTAYVLGVPGMPLHHSNNSPVKVPWRVTSTSACIATAFTNKVQMWSGYVVANFPTV